MNTIMSTLLRWSTRLIILSVLAVIIAVAAVWLIIAPTLPDVDELRDVQMQVPLRILAADGSLIQEIGEQRRAPVRIDDVPEQLIQAFLAIEDSRFYSHPGIDWRGTLRGFLLYVRSRGEGRVPGGSTITQQVARRFYLTTEYSITRKLREMLLALKIERELSKDEILELYLNKEFLGHRAYGVSAAAQVYYGKTLDELTLAECATLAALPQAPSRVNPITAPEATRIRRDYVLQRMHLLDFISRDDMLEAQETPTRAFYHGTVSEVYSPWIAEMVRREAIALLGEEEAYGGGYRAYTTIDPVLQDAATAALRAGLMDYDRRHGWRGPEGQLEADVLADEQALEQARLDLRTTAGLPAGIVLSADRVEARVLLRSGEVVTLDPESVAWARPFQTRNSIGPAPAGPADVLASGDLIRLRRAADDEGQLHWRLAQLPEVQGAFVAIAPETGAIVALVGGFDYARSQFNRAVQARRHPGSSFKPFIYAAALDEGYTPSSVIADAPIEIWDFSLQANWRPRNFDGRFMGPMRLRKALAESRNLVSVRLLQAIGLEYTMDYLTGFGFERQHLTPGLSLALGTADVTPLEVVSGFAVFANNGWAVEPQFIERIEDAHGRIVYQPQWTTLCPRCPAVRSTESGRAERNSDARIVANSPGADPPDMPQSEETGDTPADGTASTPLYRPLPLGPRDDGGDDENEEKPVEIFGPPVPRFARQVLSGATSYMIHSMMQDVITEGTGRRARELERADLAGKTGTTNDFRDVWFMGYNTKIAAGVWIGLDDFDTLGRAEQGGRTALPVWINFMRTATNGMPENPVPMPPGLASARIDPETGLRARPGNPRAIQEWFHADNLPPVEGSAEARGRDGSREEDPYDIF